MSESIKSITLPVDADDFIELMEDCQRDIHFLALIMKRLNNKDGWEFSSSCFKQLQEHISSLAVCAIVAEEAMMDEG